MFGAFWLKLRLNPCLDNDFYNRLRELGWMDWDRNLIPHAIESCDDWPTAVDLIIRFSSLVVFALVVGLVAAFMFKERPIRRATWISAVAFALPFAFAMWVYGPEYWSNWKWHPRLVLLDVSLSVAIAIALTFIAPLGAWTTLRLRRHG